MAVLSVILRPGLGFKHEGVSERTFPYWGSNGDCSHILAGTGVCAAGGQVYLLGYFR